MLNFQQKSRIIITCYRRLQPYLMQEVMDLGYTLVSRFSTGVELEGSLEDCMYLNMQLRCATQVLYSLHQFPCDSPESLYKNLKSIKWTEIIPADGYFSVTGNISHESIVNDMFAKVKVKDAIVDSFRESSGKRPNSGSEYDKTVIHLYWRGEDAEVYIDTSGESISKHGYRINPGKAPMMEALASATIMAGKWDRKSPFINLMCGSGTLAIEAALIATNRFPGLIRKNYGFMHIKGYPERFYREALAKLKEMILDVPELYIIANDNSERALEIAKRNAELAGVADYIGFDLCDFQEVEIPTEKGVVYLNPEYGERLGDIANLQETYSQIGTFFKQKCKGYSGYVFTGNLDLAKLIGLKASKRYEFYNGKIDCRLLEYELYEGTRRKDKVAEQTSE